MQLTYFPGSPFARMCRVLILEWDLPITPIQYSFPPAKEMYAINPMGQVPALIQSKGTLFPTFLILEELWHLAGHPTSAYEANRDRQTLLTILQATDACANAFYLRWSGMQPTGRNALGFDLGSRQIERTLSVLDWLEAEGRLRDGLTLCGVAVACLALWADAREGLEWRGRAKLEGLVEALSQRDSFRVTSPQAWTPD